MVPIPSFVLSFQDVVVVTSVPSQIDSIVNVNSVPLEPTMTGATDKQTHVKTVHQGIAHFRREAPEDHNVDLVRRSEKNYTLIH